MVPQAHAPRRLVVFDFDHTVVDGNSDLQVQQLSAGGSLPPALLALYTPRGWTSFMREVFRHLHRQGVTSRDYAASLATMRLVPGMGDLFARIRDIPGQEAIILSDANSIFIQLVLEREGIQVSKVFTNPAHFDQEGLLCIQEYHHQDWCPLCSKNLCKGSVLKGYLAEKKDMGQVFDQVAYVGDGKNDLCPSLTLSPGDLIFPRKGFKLESLLKEKSQDLTAEVHPWETGSDISTVLFPPEGSDAPTSSLPSIQTIR